MSSNAASSSTSDPDGTDGAEGEASERVHPGPSAQHVAAPARQVVVHKRTFVQDRPVAYSVAGTGMPVVLLHGWALGDHTYREVIAEVAAQGCHVIAPAMPGFGGTHELPKQQFSMVGYARWVADLLDALDIDEPAVVVGHSFGGGVAIRFAHDHPERVRSLVLVNSVGGSSWRQGGVIRSLAERPLWDWGLHFPSDVWPLRQATRVLPVMLEDFVPNLIRNPRAIAKVANLARRADLRAELEQLRANGMPVTILWGSRDGIIPRESFEAMCIASGVEGRIVDGSHSWLLADPEQFGEVITNDVNVARLARDLEREAAAARSTAPTLTTRARRKAAQLPGARRVASLVKRSVGTADGGQAGPTDSEIVTPPGDAAAVELGDQR